MEYIKTEDINLWYATTIEDLDLIITVLKQYELIALDTETYINLSKINSSALDPHSSKISLIQVNTIDNKEPYIIDVIRLKNKLERFNQEILLNNNIRKVIHNASFDIKQFYNLFKTWPKNVWCTRTLMQSLGCVTGYKASLFRGHRLIDLARDYFDILLDKTEAVSQWGARPLSSEQLAYCALDVGAPLNKNINSILLEGYNLLKDELDNLNQEIAYESDQMAMYLSAKMEYIGLKVDETILQKIHDYSQQETIKYRNYLVKELGFTIYNNLDINEEGEWISIEVIPDKVKTLLNNNRDLITHINKKLMNDVLSSLQAEEIRNYLDVLESDVIDNKEEFDEEFLNFKYNNITLIKSLLSYKKYSKLLSECQKYFRVINKNTGHVHAGFNPLGTSTGRFSSAGDLNLQQVSCTQVVIEIDKDEF